MEHMLLECCQIMIELLNKLKDSGEITNEEYKKHIELKIKYINSIQQKKASA